MTPLQAVPEPEEDYAWAMPVDYAILRELPKQGSRLGYHVLGNTVRIITQTLNAPLPREAHLSSGVVGQRITRWLIPKGMAMQVKIHGARGAKGYQATERGRLMLAADPDRKEGDGES